MGEHSTQKHSALSPRRGLSFIPKKWQKEEKMALHFLVSVQGLILLNRTPKISPQVRTLMNPLTQPAAPRVIPRPGAQLRVCCVFRAEGPGPVASLSDFPAHPSFSRNVTTGATAWSTSQGLRHSQALPSAAIPPPRLSSARDGSTREVLPSALPWMAVLGTPPELHRASETQRLSLQRRCHPEVLGTPPDTVPVPRDCHCRADVTQRVWGHPLR